MSSAAKQAVDPAARTQATPRRGSATAEEAPVADAVADGAARALSGAGVGFPALRRFASPQQHQTLLALQRTHGNAAVQRLLARELQRHTSVELEEGEDAIQRHTSVELEEPENAIRRLALIQRDLAADLSQAMRVEGGVGLAIIPGAIQSAPADARRAVLNNSPLMAELKGWLPRSTMVRALHLLGAPLADQLDAAMDGAGVDSGGLFSAIESPTTTADQKRLVLRNSALMARLRGELYQDAALRAMRGLGASLTELLYAAMEDTAQYVPANQETLLAPIAAAPAAEKLAALRDRALIGRLAGKLSLATMLRALEALGASLADRLNMAIDGAIPDTKAVDAIVAGATEAQRREILENTALVARLGGKVSRVEMRSLLSRLGASLADQLKLALDGGEADAPGTLLLIETADQAERELVRENTALVGRMRGAMSAPVFERAGVLLGLPVPVAGSGPSGPMTLGGPGPGAGVASGAGTDLAEPATLVGKVSAALDQAPPDVATAIVAISGGTPGELATVRGDATLRERLYAALDQAQLLHVMGLLGVGLGPRLTTLLDRKTTVADLRAHVAAATPAEKRAVLDDRVLIERLVAYAGEAQRTALLGALGDSLGNQIDQVLAGTPTLAALWNLIRGAADPARREVSGSSALMGRIAAAFGAYDVFRTEVLLIYGNETAYPGPVRALVATIASPTLWAARSALRNLADADLGKVKTPVREYLRPRLGEADFATLLRILDQGLIDEETVHQQFNETLQGDALRQLPGFMFAPMQFTVTRGFDVAYFRDRVQVVVRIQFDPIDGDSLAQAALPALMPAWETAIEGAWDNRFRLRNAARTLPIRIDMVYNSGSPHHRVKVGSKTNPVWPEFNAGTWFYQATTYNLANTVLHEFGHMLGNEDEYNLSAADYQRVVGTPAATDPNVGPAGTQTDMFGNQHFTNRRSVMGSPAVGAGTVDRRHLNYFTNWINNHRQAGEPRYTLI
jgi:hypothetical protein